MLNERFAVLDCLGGNDWAATYRARDEDADGRLRVLQVVRRDVIGDALAVRRFVAERENLLTLNHQHVVPVEGIVVEAASVTIVSDHVAGPDLGRFRFESGRTLPPASAVALACQVLTGLDALHGVGIVHGRLRPEAVLLARSTAGTQAQIAGAALGAAGRRRLDRLTRLPRPIPYSAPEVLRGAVPGPASDIYAAGVLLYELLAGRTPFATGDADAVLHGQLHLAPPTPSDVPEQLWAVLTMMLSKDPRERPASALSVADGLSALAPDFAGLVSAPPMAEPDPFSLRPAVSVGRARRQSSPEGTVLDGRPAPSGTPAAQSVPGLPTGYLPAYPPVWVPAPVAETPVRRKPALVGGAVALLGLAALTGLVTVNAGGRHSGPTAALPFATESYQQSVLVSRTWSLPTGSGSRLHAVVRVQRVAPGGPSRLAEVLPWSVPTTALKTSRGMSAVSATTVSSLAEPVADGGAVQDALRYAPPSKVGATTTYTYDVATPTGAVTSARLQGWAVDQNSRIETLSKSLGAPVPVTVTSLATSTPAISMTTGGPGFTLALSGGNTNQDPVPASALRNVEFSSDDASVASVDAAGQIQPRAAGSTLITARLGPLAATATILVSRPGDAQQVAWLQRPNGSIVVSPKTGVPASPSQVTVKPGDGSALVVWSRPDNGGADIKGYAIFANGKLVQFAPATSNSLLVKDLVRGRAYRFTVVAVNKAGMSPASPPSAPVVPERGLPAHPTTCLPATPTAVHVALLGQNTAHVTWAAPQVTAGCELSAIKVTSYPYGRTVMAAPGATSVDIPGLNAVTAYEFGVTSDWADAPSQTAPRSAPVYTTSGLCPDGSYSNPCPVSTGTVAPVAAPITHAPTGPVTVAGPAQPLPVVTDTSTPPASPQPVTSTPAGPPATTVAPPPAPATTAPETTAPSAPVTEAPTTAVTSEPPTDPDTSAPTTTDSPPDTTDTSAPSDTGSATG